MEAIDYSLLRRIQAKERSGEELAVLSGDFPDKAREFVRACSEKLEKNFDLVGAREFENSLKILRDINDRRMHKILLKALRARKGAEEETAGLTGEEQKFFQNVVELLRQNEERFENILSKKMQAVKEEATLITRAQGHELKFVLDIPCFVGIDLNNYGPFKAGERAVLPESEAELLLKKKLAEIVSE